MESWTRGLGGSVLQMMARYDQCVVGNNRNAPTIHNSAIRKKRIDFFFLREKERMRVTAEWMVRRRWQRCLLACHCRNVLVESRVGFTSSRHSLLATPCRPCPKDSSQLRLPFRLAHLHTPSGRPELIVFIQKATDQPSKQESLGLISPRAGYSRPARTTSDSLSFLEKAKSVYSPL